MTHQKHQNIESDDVALLTALDGTDPVPPAIVEAMGGNEYLLREDRARVLYEQEREGDES